MERYKEEAIFQARLAMDRTPEFLGDLDTQQAFMTSDLNWRTPILRDRWKFRVCLVMGEKVIVLFWREIKCYKLVLASPDLGQMKYLLPGSTPDT